MSEQDKIAQIRALVANDAWAISFQTFGQYRTALLNAIDLIEASGGPAEHDGKITNNSAQSVWVNGVEVKPGESVRAAASIGRKE